MVYYHIAGGIADRFFVGAFFEQGFYDEFYQCGLPDLAGTPYRKDIPWSKLHLIRYSGPPAIFLVEITAYMSVLVDVRLSLPPAILDGIICYVHQLVLWFSNVYKCTGIAIPELFCSRISSITIKHIHNAESIAVRGSFRKCPQVNYECASDLGHNS